jgi:hypothetical protein
MPAILILVAAAVAAVPAARADTLHVPAEYATIQSAIDAAADGDVVEIADGTYTGAGNKELDFRGKPITVRSASGDPGTCILDCEGTGRGFLFHSGEGADSLVAGLTVANGSAELGGAVSCTDGSSPSIVKCTMINGTGRTFGGGLYCKDSSPTLIDCRISRNSAGHGGGLLVEGGHPTLLRCTINNNTTNGTGGGAFFYGSFASVTSCRFIENRAPSCGALVFFFDAYPTLTNCIITGNSAETGGAACGQFNSAPTLVNCIFTDNQAIGFGGALLCADETRPTLSNCVLWGDAPEEIFVFGGTPTLSYCDIQGGWAGTGNISSDPRFVDPDGPDDDPRTWEDNDFRLAGDSPCIDAADNLALPADALDLDGDGDTSEPIPFDFDGRPRFVDHPDTNDTGRCGNPCTRPIVDMGAHEYQVAAPCVREPEWVCDGDVDGNGAVNPIDVGLVQAAFCSAGDCSDDSLCQYDLDCNGAINPVDAGLVQSLFGLCNAPRDVCP